MTGQRTCILERVSSIYKTKITNLYEAETPLNSSFPVSGQLSRGGLVTSALLSGMVSFSKVLIRLTAPIDVSSFVQLSSLVLCLSHWLLEESLTP